MSKMYYPAIFHAADEGGYWITFPDFDNIYTQGDTIDEAYEMAFNALGLEIMDRNSNDEIIPKPTSPANLETNENDRIVIVQFDKDEYERKTKNFAVKKTLSIPSWLNEAAIAKGLNFSAILQKALREELNL